MQTLFFPFFLFFNPFSTHKIRQTQQMVACWCMDSTWSRDPFVISFFLSADADRLFFTQISQEKTSLRNPVLSGCIQASFVCANEADMNCASANASVVWAARPALCWQRELRVIQNAKMNHSIDAPRGGHERRAVSPRFEMLSPCWLQCCSPPACGAVPMFISKIAS